MFRTIREVQYALLVSLLACGGCARSGATSQSHEQQIARGRQLYDDNGCAACHGAEGHGDGPLTKSAGLTPRDFHQPQTFINGYGVDQIASSIDDGVVQGNQIMPAFTHLSEDDRKLLAVFIMSLRDNSKPDNSNKEN